MEENKSYFDEFDTRKIELINFLEIEARSIGYNFYLDCIEISNENIYRFDFKLFQLYKLSFVNCVFNCFVFNSKDIILDIQNNIFIHKCIFKKDVDINDVTFRKRLDITFCVFEAKCRFNMNIFFEFCNFKDNLFNNAQFEKNQFLNDIMFYNSDFNMFNFSQSIFKGSLNVVNTNLNFTFDDLQEKIKQECENFNKYKNEQNEKSLNKFANDFRDSFRVFKNALIKDNNLLEASNFHKYELYCKEIELKNKKDKTFKDVVDKYQLFFYRKLCDHHTDLLKVFHNLLIIIMLFSVFSFVLDKFKQPSIENNAKYHIVQVDTNESYIFKEHNKTTYNFLSLNIEQEFKNLDNLLSKTEIYFSLGFVLLVTFVALLNKQYLWLLLMPLFIGVVYCIGFPISFITHFMIIMLFACTFIFIMVFDSKPERFLFVGISYIVCIFTLLAKPSLMLPVFGSFLEKDTNATYSLLLSLSVVYFILVALVIFSLQKTARKNSIVPS
ncbi:UNVERIFIED_CONTAM: hypothetical protein O8I53_03930 [Campylobacter lari]|uniref:Putative membrane protein n=2 Tax=Campylobacter lari TaxID=201 RepID=B9KDY2_CAMLR|nr:hypothetical protein [Campylobacter lari]ACM64770.2 putative membrane protein [Campylobacter lari RM2100]EAJ0337524.1 hypothetical protein [Campylobacter lari]EAJ0337879.1 hypothetical protein [Campylobacter lari]EAK0793603.1 hypothetical protein [Campylobacter lari]MCV3342004.1 hypothetical protein [Campylobacter lari]